MTKRCIVCSEHKSLGEFQVDAFGTEKSDVCTPCGGPNRNVERELALSEANDKAEADHAKWQARVAAASQNEPKVNVKALEEKKIEKAQAKQERITAKAQEQKRTRLVKANKYNSASPA